ncbi:MAG: trehalase family glycosidase [Hyphomicrobiaceae bacterium]
MSLERSTSAKCTCIAISILLISALSGNGSAQTHAISQERVWVDVTKSLGRLIQEEDTDGDKKITVEDTRAQNGRQGDQRFWLVARNGKRYQVVGTYYLSNLLQELKLAQDTGQAAVPIDISRVFENPVPRISRSIREIYWDALTRRIDEAGLRKVLFDEKMATGGVRYLYVPHSHPEAFQYFSDVAARYPALKLVVERLPQSVTPEFVRSLAGRHGLLALALDRNSEGDYAGVPFVVPGGRFNEMYGWDSYFEALGLLADGRVDLAKAMVDNFVYQITHYGKILNANRTYYLTRSQPPFLTSMALAVHTHLPRNDQTKTWLNRVFSAAISEYKNVWTHHERLTAIGLSRYYGSGLGPPPEVEPGHFDAIYAPHATAGGMDISTFERMFKTGEIKVPQLTRFFVHDRCVRESGHDTTYRWERGGDRCADFVTVDLNSLLYKFELDIARTIDREFGGKMAHSAGHEESSVTWFERAIRRKDLINTYLWDEKRSSYFDYDLERQDRYNYVSATSLYPLWAGYEGEPETWLANSDQAKMLVSNVLPRLEEAGGIVASNEQSRGPLTDERPARQWDYPNGWAPHQMLVWRGLLNHGFDEIAHRLIYRWLYTIARNAVDYNGTVPEKLDVVARSHKVFAEYGNVGTKFSYITREGFGWVNASYQVGLARLPQNLRKHLEDLVPPEWLFER